MSEERPGPHIMPSDRGKELASHIETLATALNVSNAAALRHRRPKGECVHCDMWGDDPGMPSHTASDQCESGKHPHCTCDTCY